MSNDISMKYTPIANQDEKLDIMEHINQEHTEEVLIIAQHFYSQKNIISADIDDIFEEGLIINANIDNSIEKLFVAFELKGELEEQVLYLAYLAMAKQGKDLTGNKQQYFTVTDKQTLSKNITRITLKSDIPLPEDYAGYAYGMMLKIMKSVPKAPTNQNKPHSVFKKLGNQAFLWGLKKLSSEKRKKMVSNLSKGIRLYTLRKAWKSDNSDFYDMGYMDIFTHGNSEGSKWVDNLQKNDIISSRSGTEDKHQFLETGCNVLIADETAYPALAGILDFWSNPTPPTVIILSSEPEAQSYIKAEEINLPAETELHQIIIETDKQAEAVIDVINKLDKIDGVWGGFENQSAKKVRHHLRNQYQLTAKTNHVKGYWRKN